MTCVMLVILCPNTGRAQAEAALQLALQVLDILRNSLRNVLRKRCFVGFSEDQASVTPLHPVSESGSLCQSQERNAAGGEFTACLCLAALRDPSQLPVRKDGVCKRNFFCSSVMLGVCLCLLATHNPLQLSPLCTCRSLLLQRTPLSPGIQGSGGFHDSALQHFWGIDVGFVCHLAAGRAVGKHSLCDHVRLHDRWVCTVASL